MFGRRFTERCRELRLDCCLFRASAWARSQQVGHHSCLEASESIVRAPLALYTIRNIVHADGKYCRELSQVGVVTRSLRNNVQCVCSMRVIARVLEARVSSVVVFAEVASVLVIIILVSMQLVFNQRLFR